MISPHLIRSVTLRSCVGGVVLISGVVGLLKQGDGAVCWSFTLLGVIILLHLALELYWLYLGRVKGTVAHSSSSNAAPSSLQRKDEFTPMISVLVATPGVILGLLVDFTANSKSAIGLALKIGALALAGSMVLAVAILGLRLADEPKADSARFLLTTALNVTFWFLALGLLCIGFTLVFD